MTLSTKATIQYLDDAGAVAETKTSWRNLPDIIRTLGATLAVDKDKKVRVIVEPEAGSPPITNEAGEKVDYIVVEGVVREVIQDLVKRAVPPQVVFSEFQRLAGFMTDNSDLKGIIVTMVFGDAHPGGFGMLSTSSDVTNPDIVVLVESARAQTQQMQDEMKKHRPNISFPGDNGGLILPGRDGFSLPKK